jgi:hypothetical protein
MDHISCNLSKGIWIELLEQEKEPTHNNEKLENKVKKQKKSKQTYVITEDWLIKCERESSEGGKLTEKQQGQFNREKGLLI